MSGTKQIFIDQVCFDQGYDTFSDRIDDNICDNQVKWGWVSGTWKMFHWRWIWCKTIILIGLPVRESLLVCLYDTYDTAIILIGAPIILDTWCLSFLLFKVYDTRSLDKYYYWLANQSSAIRVCTPIKVVAKSAEVRLNWSCC